MHMCAGVGAEQVCACMCMYVACMCIGFQRTQKRALALLELEQL